MNLSNENLISKTHALMTEERKLTLEILNHLREIEARKLYLDRGFPSLFEMCIGEFKCSPAYAQRRISAMRLMKDVPEIAPRIENGNLNLSTLSLAQSFFLAEKKEARMYSPEEKLNLLQSFEGKSTREVEKVLIQKNSKVLRRETVRAVSEDQAKLTLVLSHELIRKLDELKDHMSHSNPSMTYEGLIDLLATQALKKKTAIPKSRKQCPAHLPSIDATPLPAPEGTARQTRYIPSRIKARIRQRDQCCTYVDPETHRLCGSKTFLEYDHIHPYAQGGQNTEENLRLLCRAHNQHRAQRISGA